MIRVISEQSGAQTNSTFELYQSKSKSHSIHIPGTGEGVATNP